MQKFFDWLVRSSTNPQVVALTIKGVVVTFLPLLLIAGKYWGLNAGALGSLPDQVENVVVIALGLVGGAMTLVGLVRKVWNSLHAV